MGIEEMGEGEVLGVHMDRDEGVALIVELLLYTQPRRFRTYGLYRDVLSVTHLPSRLSDLQPSTLQFCAPLRHAR